MNVEKTANDSLSIEFTEEIQVIFHKSANLLINSILDDDIMEQKFVIRAISSTISRNHGTREEFRILICRESYWELLLVMQGLFLCATNADSILSIVILVRILGFKSINYSGLPNY